MISLKDALAIMNSKEEPFSIEFTKKSTGEVVRMDNCTLVGSAHDMNKHRTITVMNIEAKQPRTVKVRLINYFNGEKVFW
jgi:hypothetical protein